MKKGIGGIMVFVLLCSLLVMPIRATENETVLKHNMDDFFEAGLGETLVKRTNFYYMDFVEELRSNEKLNVYMVALDIIYNDLYSGLGEPSEKKYTEALINVMKTYESDNAEDIAEQHKLDYQKSAVDYASDVAQATVSFFGMSETAKSLDPKMELIVNEVFSVISQTNNNEQLVGDFTALIDNYSRHDSFLEIVEKNATGNLKDAAIALRADIKELMTIILGEVTEFSVLEAGKSIPNKIFSDYLVDLLKNNETYKNNMLVQDILPVVAKSIKSGLEGLDLGKLAGNILVKGEDGLNCFLELKANYDISLILEVVLKYYEMHYDELFQKDGASMIENYADYGKYLVSCRTRGEYLFYSMFVDRGLHDIFRQDAEEEAEKHFLEMTERLKFLKGQLDNLLKTSMLEISDYFYKREELVGLMSMELYVKHNISEDSQAFTVDGFCLEWYDSPYGDYSMFSMTNNGCDYIKLFDIVLGDTLKESEEKLYDRDWIEYYQYENTFQYVKIENENRYLLSINVDETNKVIGWEIMDWPEGDHISDFFENLEKGDIKNELMMNEKEICEIVASHYNTENNTNKYVAYEYECLKTQDGYSLVIRSTDEAEANRLLFCVDVNLSTGEVTNDLGDKWQF